MQNKDIKYRRLLQVITPGRENNQLEEIKDLQAFYEQKRNSFWFRLFFPTRLAAALNEDTFSPSEVYLAYFARSLWMRIFFGGYPEIAKFNNAKVTRTCRELYANTGGRTDDVTGRSLIQDARFEDIIAYAESPFYDDVNFTATIIVSPTFVKQMKVLSYLESSSRTTQIRQFQQARLDTTTSPFNGQSSKVTDETVQKVHDLTADDLNKILAIMDTAPDENEKFYPILKIIIDNGKKDLLEILHFLILNKSSYVNAKTIKSNAISLLSLKKPAYWAKKIRNRREEVLKTAQERGDKPVDKRIDPYVTLTLELQDALLNAEQGLFREQNRRTTLRKPAPVQKKDSKNSATIQTENEPPSPKPVETITPPASTSRQQASAKVETSPEQAQEQEAESFSEQGIRDFLSYAHCWERLTAHNKDICINLVKVMDDAQKYKLQSFFALNGSYINQEGLEKILTKKPNEFEKLADFIHKIQRKAKTSQLRNVLVYACNATDMDTLDAFVTKLFEVDISKIFSDVASGIWHSTADSQKTLSKVEALESIAAIEPSKHELEMLTNILGRVVLTDVNIHNFHAFYEENKFKSTYLGVLQRHPQQVLDLYSDQFTKRFLYENLDMIMRIPDEHFAKIYPRIKTLEAAHLIGLLNSSYKGYVLTLDDNTFRVLTSAGPYLQRIAPKTDLFFKQLRGLEFDWRNVCLFLEILDKTNRLSLSAFREIIDSALLNTDIQILQKITSRLDTLTQAGFNSNGYSMERLITIGNLTDQSFRDFCSMYAFAEALPQDINRFNPKIQRSGVEQFLDILNDFEDPHLGTKLKKSQAVLQSLGMDNKTIFDILAYSDYLRSSDEDLSTIATNVRKFQAQHKDIIQTSLASSNAVESDFYSSCIDCILKSSYFLDSPTACKDDLDLILNMQNEEVLNFLMNYKGVFDVNCWRDVAVAYVSLKQLDMSDEAIYMKVSGIVKHPMFVTGSKSSASISDRIKQSVAKAAASMSGTVHVDETKSVDSSVRGESISSTVEYTPNSDLIRDLLAVALANDQQQEKILDFCISLPDFLPAVEVLKKLTELKSDLSQADVASDAMLKLLELSSEQINDAAECLHVLNLPCNRGLLTAENILLVISAVKKHSVMSDLHEFNQLFSGEKALTGDFFSVILADPRRPGEQGLRLTLQDYRSPVVAQDRASPTSITDTAHTGIDKLAGKAARSVREKMKNISNMHSSLFSKHRTVQEEQHKENTKPSSNPSNKSGGEPRS